MGIAVDLNDKSRTETHEIDDVPTDHVLSAELPPVEPVRTKSRPKKSLGLTHFDA